MPYIKQRRKELDGIVDLMVKKEVRADGDLNYILYKFCKYHVTPGYNNYKNFNGELTECVAEIRRTLLAEYEMQKIKENGDV